MRAENFVYFSIVSGFFIGIIFGVIYDFDIKNLIFATIIITMIFYAIALGSVAFYIKYFDIKKRFLFNIKEIEEIIDIQINEIEKFENFIFDSYKFIENLEKEELEIIRKKKI